VEESDGVGRGLVTVGVVVLIGLVGLLAFLAGRGDPGDAVRRSDERFPETTTTQRATTTTATAPPSTITSTTTATGVTAAGVPATTPVTATTLVTTTTTPAAAIGELVPNVAAFEQLPPTPADAQVQIDQLLAGGRHDVAAPGPVLALCASVPLDAPVQAGARWERDGEEIASSAALGRVPPGFGECFSDGGEPLPDGSYQFVAVDTDGNESAAGGIVVGARRVEQNFTNNGEEPLCALRIAPESSRYFEVYLYDANPIAPGASVALPVADVDQDVEAVACGSGEVVAAFDFAPQAGEVQQLVP
jgi:hypothetical protein